MSELSLSQELKVVVSVKVADTSRLTELLHVAPEDVAAVFTARFHRGVQDLITHLEDEINDIDASSGIATRVEATLV